MNSKKTRAIIIVILCIAVVVVFMLQKKGTQNNDLSSKRNGVDRTTTSSSTPSPNHLPGAQVKKNVQTLASKEQVLPQKNHELLSEGEMAINKMLEELTICPVGLTEDDYDRAIRTFKWELRSWSTIKNGTASFKTVFRRIKNGEIVEGSEEVKTGSMVFNVALIEDLDKNVPVRLDMRIIDDKRKLTFVGKDLFRPQNKMYCYGDGLSFDTNAHNGAATTVDDAFIELLFYPMVKIIANNKFGDDDYFSMSGSGYPRRLSTEQETTDKFNGEPQILVMPEYSKYSPRYWLCLGGMELRKIEVPLSAGKAIKTYHYERYCRKDSDCIKFPENCTMTYLTNNGKNGWEYTIELSDPSLNTDIATDTFEHPATSVLARKVSFE